MCHIKLLKLGRDVMSSRHILRSVKVMDEISKWQLIFGFTWHINPSILSENPVYVWLIHHPNLFQTKHGLRCCCVEESTRNADVARRKWLETMGFRAQWCRCCLLVWKALMAIACIATLIAQDITHPSPHYPTALWMQIQNTEVQIRYRLVGRHGGWYGNNHCLFIHLCTCMTEAGEGVCLGSYLCLLTANFTGFTFTFAHTIFRCYWILSFFYFLLWNGQ